MMTGVPMIVGPLAICPTGPSTTNRPQATRSGADPHDVSRLRSISALLVDVPASQAAQLERVLEEAGWQVRSVAVNGTEGLTAALQRRGWQVVLYGGEGSDAVPSSKALALVKLADPHLPFIAISRVRTDGSRSEEHTSELQ